MITPRMASLPCDDAACLRRRPGELRHVLSQFGKIIGSPCRIDEKSAALGAWLARAAQSHP